SVGEKRDERRRHGDASARSVLGDGAGGDMDVDVAPGENLVVNAERPRARLDEAQRRLGAFLHHLAELAGEDEPAGSGRARRLDEENVAAERRPGKPGGDAGNAGAHRDFVLKAPRAQDGGEVADIDPRARRLAFGYLHGDMTED